MSSPPPPSQRPIFDRYVVISVATTTDEHGVYVTKDSAEVIELGWMLLDGKSLEEVRIYLPPACTNFLTPPFTARSRQRTHQTCQYTNHTTMQCVTYRQLNGSDH